MPAGRLVYFHNHGAPGPGIYLPERWRNNRAVFAPRGSTLADPGDAALLQPLLAEGLYRVLEPFTCCEKRCRTYARELLVQLGYDGEANPIVFVPEWTDDVFARVRKKFPMVSRATVYNTLNVLVEKGLLRALVIAEGKVVFDPKTEAHHHFIDEATGAIHDVPWDALQVSDVGALPGLDVREYQVVLRGRRRKAGR